MSSHSILDRWQDYITPRENLTSKRQVRKMKHHLFVAHAGELGQTVHYNGSDGELICSERLHSKTMLKTTKACFHGLDDSENGMSFCHNMCAGLAKSLQFF